MSKKYHGRVYLDGTSRDSPCDDPIRLVHISDTHNRSYGGSSVPDGDVLVHTGDFTNGGSKEELDAFVRWFSALPHPNKVVIVGNHEFGRTNFAQLHALFSPAGIVYLQDSGATVCGLRVWGSPWSNFDAHEKDRQTVFDMTPKHTDVLLTHNPPFNIMDLAWRSHKVLDGVCAVCHQEHSNYSHWGCRALRRVVERKQIPLHLFGHVHDVTGVETHGATVFGNAAMDIDRTAVTIEIHHRRGAGVPAPPSFVGWHHLRSALTRLVLDVDYARTTPGTAVIAYSALKGAPPQQCWAMTSNPGAIVSALGGDRKLVLVPNRVGSVGDAPCLVTKLSDGGHDEDWLLTPEGRLVHVSSNCELVVGANSNSGVMLSLRPVDLSVPQPLDPYARWKVSRVE
eukprot:PhM_4_TR9249/c0_g1_i1/m.24376